MRGISVSTGAAPLARYGAIYHSGPIMGAGGDYYRDVTSIHMASKTTGNLHPCRGGQVGYRWLLYAYIVSEARVVLLQHMPRNLDSGE